MSAPQQPATTGDVTRPRQTRARAQTHLWVVQRVTAMLLALSSAGFDGLFLTELAHGLMFLVWVKDNIPNAKDIAWFKAGGGLVGGGHPPAGRFNGGQKMVFWITVIGGSAVAISGYILIFPFWVTDIAGMQLAHIVHGVISVLMIAAMIGHIYIGSVGMEGAFDAMGSGEVDLNWAKEHHSLWVEEEMAKARTTIAGPAGAKAAGAD